MPHPRILATVLCLAGLPSAVLAVHSLTDFSTPYSQNFDSLGPVALVNENSTGEIRIWTDNVTLPGWYVRLNDAFGQLTPVNGGDGLGLRYVSGTGAANTSRLPSVRNNGRYSIDSYTGTPDDRALGLAMGSSANTHSGAMGVAFRNDSTNRAISRVSLSYSAEQWRRSAAGRLLVAYAVMPEMNADRLVGSEGWTELPEITFPAATGTSSGLDGNLVAYPRSTVVDLAATVKPGEVLVIRWYYPPVNSGGHLAIDNFVANFETVEYTPPTPAAPPVLAATAEPAGLVLRWTQPAGKRGILEGATAPGGEWLPLQTSEPGASAVPVEFTDATLATTPERFYRLRVE